MRTDRYLYANYGTGEQELYDLRSDPFELQNRPAIPPTPGPGRAAAPALLARRNCAGKTCRARPAVKLKAADCSSAKVAGKGKPQEATFYLRGKKVGRDAKPPIRASSAQASSGDQAGGGGDLARRAGPSV